MPLELKIMVFTNITKPLLITLAVLSALGAAIAAIQDEFAITEKKILLYCNTNDYVELEFMSFSQCEARIREVTVNGAACGCRRVDGVFGVISKVTQWLF